MSIPELFIKRPVMTTLVMMAIPLFGIDEVFNTVQSGNVNMPTGTRWGRAQSFTVQANGQLTDARLKHLPGRLFDFCPASC
jgi:multidrug efflux pump subunit AcrB